MITSNGAYEETAIDGHNKISIGKGDGLGGWLDSRYFLKNTTSAHCHRVVNIPEPRDLIIPYQDSILTYDGKHDAYARSISFKSPISHTA